MQISHHLRKVPRVLDMGTRMSNVPVDEAHIYIYAIMHCGCIGIPLYLMVTFN